MLKRLISAGLLAAAMTQAPVFAQSEESNSGRSEASVQALGSFLKSTTQNGVNNDATNSGGVLASYRYFFNAHQGLEANYGYTRNTNSYGLPSGPFGVPANNHEISADYVFRFRLPRVSPFVLAGAGALIFSPTNNALPGTTTQTRAAFVYGGGTDINVTSHIFLRAEYRGFIFNSPTYDATVLSGLNRTTHLAEPSIGFGYRF